MGKFIIIEGPDFCGKSTQIDLLTVNRVMTGALGDNVFFTREPGSYLPESMEVCESIRDKILNNDNTLMDEAKLFAESRYYHTEEIVKLVNKYDSTIISDRYIVSSLAYQGFAQGLGPDIIYELNKPSLDLLSDNNIDIYCIKFVIDELEWLIRRQKRLQKEAADSIEQKDIHRDVLHFFINDRIFDFYTKDIKGFHLYNVNAGQDKYNVYSNFLEVINNI